MRHISPVYLLILAFTVSVFLRFPNLDRPLSSNYEWVTAHTLITLNIWKTEGITQHKFNPIYTFPNPNDRYIKCPISGVADSKGNYYYVSYPPFAFILPYIVFKVTHIPINPISLQLFNIALHLGCLLFLYFLIKSFYQNTKNGAYAALSGALVYLFAPINLWYHSNVYFADILVQLFFLSTLYFYYKYLATHRREHSIGLYISIFLMVYTEWLGVLLVAVLFFHSAFFNKRKVMPMMIAAVSLAALGLVVLQYSLISGFEDFINTLLSRYSDRRGIQGVHSILTPEAHLHLVRLYLHHYYPYFVLLFSGFIAAFYLKKQANELFIHRREVSLLLLAGIPVLLHHYLLFEFTLVHELSLVKSAVPISLIISFLTYKIIATKKKTYLAVLQQLYFIIFVAMLSLGIYFYYSHIIWLDEFVALKIGTQIKETSSPDETIFFLTTDTQGDFLVKAPDNYVVAPQIHYYSDRCMQVVPKEQEAVDHLIQTNKKQGIIYTVIDSSFEVLTVTRIYNPNFID